MSDTTVTIPALGRQGFSLGCLYDLSTNQIDPRKLWNEDQLTDAKLDIQEHGTSNFAIAIANNREERCKHLDVKAAIRLEIGAGAVKVEGSAKYVNDSNSNSQVCSVTYTSKKLTKTKKLTMDQLAPGNVTYRTMLEEEKNATHVVSSITYGKSAHFRFESKVDDNKEKDKIAGYLKLEIEKINAKGNGAMVRTSDEKKFSEETSCHFFGDYSGINPPLNLEQARETIVAIEKDEKNPLGVPIEVTLTPLSSLTTAAMKIVASLSAGTVNEARRLLQDIEDIQVLLRTSEKSKTAEHFYTFKTRITEIANSYRNRASELKSELCKILPKIKGNGAKEQDLMEIIRDYDSSAFSKANTLNWVKRLEAEVLYVDGIIENATASGIPISSSEHQFRVQQMNADNGLFYCEAEFLSCLQVGGEEDKGKVSLRSGGILDDTAAMKNFQKQYSAFRRALRDGKVVENNAISQPLLHLKYMGNTNQCDTKFYEEGEDVLQEINPSSKIEEESLKYDPVKGAIIGQIGPVAKEGGQIKLRLCYTEDGGEGGEREKTFDHPAEKRSFQLDMKEHDHLHEGGNYTAKLRFEIRPGFVSRFVDFKFRARESPVIAKLSSPIEMEVGVANQIDCEIEKGYPKPTIQWRKKGEDDILSDKPSLMFANPTKMDQATYHVKVENVVGSAEQEVLVKVTDTYAEKEQTLEEMFARKMETMDQKLVGLSRDVGGGWTKIFEQSTEFALSQNNLLTTIPRLTKEWVVEFCFKPTNFNFGDWTNIIQMTIGGRHGSYGDRTPGVFYHPTQLGPSQLHFASAVNNNPNFWLNLPAPSVGKWTKIRVSQELLNTNKLMYRVIIDGVEKINVENKNTGLFQNVKVFAANPWHHAQPGFVKGLIIQIKGE